MIFDLEIDKCCQRHNGPNALTCTASRKPCMNSISEWVEQCASMLLYVNCCHIDTFLPLEFLSTANSGRTDGCILVLWSERLRPQIHRGQCVRPRTDSPGICLSFRHTLGTTRVMLQNAFFRWSNIKHYNLLGHTHTSWIFSLTHYLTNLTDQNLWMCKPHSLHEISRIKGKVKGPFPKIRAPLDL